MFGLLVILLAMLIVPPFLERISYHMARGRQQAAREELAELTPTEFSNTSRLVAEAVEDSVVYISTRGLAVSGVPARQIPALATAGQGSGVVVDAEGYVMTNFHVVAGATNILVHLNDGRTEVARLVGVDEYTDLAVLKITVDGLLALEWGDSDELKSGDPVWAVGSPYGLDNSITFGIVSAKGRDGIGRTRYQDLLQTDAAVNPGNSGGALVDASGKMVGINTAIVGTTYRGISFAIPSNMAREVFEQLKSSGLYARGWLGVQLDKVTREQASAAGMDNTDGVLVVGVLPDSPASQSGIRQGDVIVEWDGQVVADARRLSFLVAATKPDSAAKVEIIRDGERIKLDVKVGQLPSLVER